MSSKSPSGQRPVRGSIVRIHRWLGLGAAIFWLVQAFTGMILSFGFEIDDALITTAERPTDWAAIERRMDAIAADGTGAEIDWIWTTAGLPHRYVISYADADGTARMARIDGAGEVLRDTSATDYTFIELMRHIHIDLLSGDTGQWIMAVTGTLLVTNLVFGLVLAWPGRGGGWKTALKPTQKGARETRLYSWHRAVGLWAAVPAIVVAGMGTLMLFEDGIRDILGAPEASLPANPSQGAPVGVAAAAQAAVAAIPGSRFSGLRVPSAQDASYYASVRAPGELRRGGYGGSLVVVDANDAGIRGVWPASEASFVEAFVGSFYPIHTGEAGGTIGRFLTMAVGVWLLVTSVVGILLWLRRRRRRDAVRVRRPAAPATIEA